MDDREAADDLMTTFLIRRQAKRDGDDEIVQTCGALAAAICIEYPEAVKLHAKELMEMLKQQAPETTPEKIAVLNKKVDDIYKISTEKHRERLH